MAQDQIDGAASASGLAGVNGGAALELSEYGDAAVVRVRGSVDAAMTRNLRDSLAWAVNQHRMVLVDVSAVDAVDGFGLGTLARAHHRATARGTPLCLVAPSGAVLTALLTARLDDLFAVFDNLPDALAGVDRWVVSLRG